MKRIRVSRVIISGVIVLLVFFAVEFIIEQLVGHYLFAEIMEEWVKVLPDQNWSAANYALNILIVLVS